MNKIKFKFFYFFFLFGEKDFCLCRIYDDFYVWEKDDDDSLSSRKVEGDRSLFPFVISNPKMLFYIFL